MPTYNAIFPTATIIWDKENKVRNERELLDIEAWIQRKLEGDGKGFISLEEKEELTRLEKI